MNMFGALVTFASTHSPKDIRVTGGVKLPSCVLEGSKKTRFKQQNCFFFLTSCSSCLFDGANAKTPKSELLTEGQNVAVQIVLPNSTVVLLYIR